MMYLDWIQSRLFGRVCYGFRRDEEGYVYIKEDETEVVRMIYDKGEQYRSHFRKGRDKHT